MRKIINHKYDNFMVETVYVDENHHNFFEVVRRNPCVIIVPVKEDKFVLIDEYRIAIDRKLLQFPAGKIERGEDPLIAARRELKEETGYSAESFVLLGKFYSAPQFTDEMFYVYKASVTDQDSQHLTQREHITPTVLSIEEVLRKIENNKILDAKTIAAYYMWRNEK